MKNDTMTPPGTLLASDIRARFRWSETTLRRRYALAGFPKPRYFGQNRIWYAEEVEAWAESHVSDCTRGVTLESPLKSAHARSATA